MGRHYELAIVGGGIVGLGHAVAALRRGLTVAVVDLGELLGLVDLERADRLDDDFGVVGAVGAPDDVDKLDLAALADFDDADDADGQPEGQALR